MSLIVVRLFGYKAYEFDSLMNHSQSPNVPVQGGTTSNSTSGAANTAGTHKVQAGKGTTRAGASGGYDRHLTSGSMMAQVG